MLEDGPFISLLADEFNEKVQEGYKIIDIRRADEWEYYGVIEEVIRSHSLMRKVDMMLIGF